MGTIKLGLKGDVAVVVVLLSISVAAWSLPLSVLTSVADIQNVKRNAVTTEGTVTDAEIESYKYEDSDDDAEEATAYRPEVTYQYTVDGERYNSTEFYDKVDHTPTYTDESDARAQLPSGRTVTVYYMPDSPDRSFLVKPSVDLLGTAAAGVPFGFFALVISYVLVRYVWSIIKDLQAGEY